MRSNSTGILIEVPDFACTSVKRQSLNLSTVVLFLRHHLVLVLKPVGERIFLEVRWLRLCTSNAGCIGSIPGLGAKIPRAA